ncbi:hypothetical protein C5469_22145 [Photorhabdus cinerea]|uniref:Uncharacterized protein n=1 Tax=Photorhabdus cinerea TaxID=471575 RepID=A0A7X5QHX5_9GAMM|nr:hypothetical protein [Photorhabdus cinerea]
MTETDRFRTLPNKHVRKSVKLISDMHYNTYTYFVQKISLCHEFLPIVGSPLWNRPPKISAEKLKPPVLALDLRD